MGSGTELAKAYVQIIPSAQGISGTISSAISGEAGSAGTSAGSIIGKNLGSVLIKTIAALGLGQLIKESLLAGADLQQSLGGVETLFKDHADTVITNAKNAYATAGLSANQYMETVTSFSASLLQSLGGDTALAAEIADMALIDMADNANKMGTSMEMIQNAYQGFAKQNYTMLDNLKLGYGGTKTEMERLLADATALTGVEYDISNLSDIYEAIHVIQGELGITGATAEEAAGTFTGSFNAMKAAAENFMANLSLGEDVGPALMTLLETAGTFALDNLLPMVGNILISLVEAIFTTDWIAVGTDLVTRIKDGISAAAIEYLGTDQDIITNLLTAISNGLPNVLNKGVETITNFVNGILSNIPSLITSMGTVMTQLLNFIYDNLPSVLKAGGDLLLNIVTGIVNNLPAIISSMISVLASLLKTIGENLPSFLQSGITILAELAAGLIQAIPDLLANIPVIVSDIIDEFGNTDWGEVGLNIIEGIANGLTDAGSIILEAIEDVAGDALDGIKELLGIHSPSRVFENEVGMMMGLGLAAGIEDSTNTVTSAMEALTESTMGVAQADLNYSANVNGTAVVETNSAIVARLESMENSFNEMVEIMNSGFDMNWDDRNLGRLVKAYA